jgi:hypothetical protein
MIVRREILNDGRCWCEIDVQLVHEDHELLAIFVAPGAPIRYPLGFHPWHPKAAWEGDGVPMLQRPGDWYSVWRFPHGWYVNFQEPYRRWDGGFDTQDLELDIWVPDDGRWEWKDRALLEQRVEEGRFTPEQAARTRAEAEKVAADLDAGRLWWASWKPDR